jgi:hypothetical protein
MTSKNANITEAKAVTYNQISSKQDIAQAKKN